MKLMTEQLLTEFVRPEVFGIVGGYLMGIVLAGAFGALLLHDALEGFILACRDIVKLILSLAKRSKFSGRPEKED